MSCCFRPAVPSCPDAIPGQIEMATAPELADGRYLGHAHVWRDLDRLGRVYLVPRRDEPPAAGLGDVDNAGALVDGRLRYCRLHRSGV